MRGFSISCRSTHQQACLDWKAVRRCYPAPARSPLYRPIGCSAFAIEICLPCVAEIDRHRGVDYTVYVIHYEGARHCEFVSGRPGDAQGGAGGRRVIVGDPGGAKVALYYPYAILLYYTIGLSATQGGRTATAPSFQHCSSVTRIVVARRNFRRIIIAPHGCGR